ncbi:MAG: flagellin [bacterium]
MVSVNTNISALYSQNFSRLNLLQYNEKVERLSNGVRINRGADDPSGLAISQGMNAQLHGVNTAIGNAQDTTTLLQLVDSYIGEQWNALARMRDLSVRLANSATLNCNPGTSPFTTPLSSDCMNLHREIELMKDHLYIAFSDRDNSTSTVIFDTTRLNYNLKKIFVNGGGGSGFDSGLPAQIGADNNVSNQVQVIIDDLTAEFSDFGTPYHPFPNPNGDADLQWYQDYANDKITSLTAKLDKLSNLRVSLGTQINTLQHTINDLSAQYTAISGSKSAISDADMAAEVAAMTTNMIKQQGTTMAASQANAEPLITTKLVQAIYDGLNQRMAFNSHVGPTAE